MWLVFLTAIVPAIQSAEKPTTLTWQGQLIANIREVKVNPDGRIVIIHENSGFSTTSDKLPPEFLEAWGITDEKIKSARAAQAKTAETEFERSVQLGLFREVAGVVYDTRKPHPDWTLFSNVQMLQVTDEGAIINISRDPQSPTVILVRNLPRTLADYERVSFTAKLVGSYSFINKLGDERTVRAYDVGRPCGREEVPAAIRREGKAWAALESKAAGTGLAKLPDTANLRGVGTGFFVSESGHLVSNWHVVRDAKAVKVRYKQKILAAEIVRMDRERDLALLRVEGGPFPALPISSESSARLGEAAFTIGFPNVVVQGLEPKYTDGKISSLTGAQDDPQQYQISVQVQPGNSGGPLMDKSGYVVGVVDAKANDLRFLAASGSLPQNVNYAIKASVLREFLEKDPKFKLPAAPTSLKAEDAVAKTEEAVAMVLVY